MPISVLFDVISHDLEPPEGVPKLRHPIIYKTNKYIKDTSAMINMYVKTTTSVSAFLRSLTLTPIPTQGWSSFSMDILFNPSSWNPLWWGGTGRLWYPILNENPFLFSNLKTCTASKKSIYF